jgi:hypothetical protein
VDAGQRRRLLRFYRICVQKHLYANGPEKRFLSKNASFSGSPEALIETFPDARFLVCDRDPLSTVPSQLSSLEPAFRLSGFDGIPDAVRHRFVELMAFYYGHLERFARAHPSQTVVVDNADLHERLAETVVAAYAHLGLPLGAEFVSSLQDADQQSRSYRSQHAYRLADYGLSKDDIRSRFSGVCAD